MLWSAWTRLYPGTQSVCVCVFYAGSVEDRRYLRHDLLNNATDCNVIVTTWATYTRPLHYYWHISVLVSTGALRAWSNVPLTPQLKFRFWFACLFCFPATTWPSETKATAAFFVSCLWSMPCLMKVTCWRTWTLCATATSCLLTLVHWHFVMYFLPPSSVYFCGFFISLIGTIFLPIRCIATNRV